MLDTPQVTWSGSHSEPDGATGGGGTPRLLPGVALGDLDTGASQPAYLLTLPDGRNFQIAAPLYHLASLVDGERSTAEIAATLSDRLGRPIQAGEVETIIAQKLVPLGIVSRDEAAFVDTGFGAPTAAPDAPLGITSKLTVLPARVFEPLAAVVKQLYSPVLAVPIVLAIVLAHVYTYQQLGPRLAEFNPLGVPLAVLLLGPLIIQFATPWHELGHAAAARYFGAKHGPLGVGFMGITLVAYVEVTDIWRLRRAQRFVVDIGGVYFQSMTVILLAGWAWATGDPTALWIAVMTDFAMLMNVNPLFKLDGYWAISDATGIPNLHQRVGDQLRGVLAGNALRIARVLHIAPLAASQRLQRAAAPTGSMDGYGSGARVALALFTVLFVVSATYFTLLMILIVPMLIVTYPMIATMAVMTVVAIVSRTADPAFATIVLMQFVFVTLMLFAVVSAFVSLVRAWRRRNRPPPGMGMGLDAGWRVRG